MQHEQRTRGHALLRRTGASLAAVLAGAVAVTWAWNTIAPEIWDLPRFRFAEGLAVAVLVLFSGALFAAGHRLVGPGRE